MNHSSLKTFNIKNVQKYRAVRFNEYGSPDVLHISELDLPTPAKGQVLIRVKVAGINTGKTAEREGAFATLWPWPLPSGQGTDFSGIVEQPGEVREAFQELEKRHTHGKIVLVP